MGVESVRDRLPRRMAWHDGAMRPLTSWLLFYQAVVAGTSLYSAVHSAHLYSAASQSIRVHGNINITAMKSRCRRYLIQSLGTRTGVRRCKTV